MDWNEANAWVAALDVAGVTGWRLPETIDVGNDGYTFTNRYQGVDAGWNITAHSELSNMYYNVLGNTAGYDTSGAETDCRWDGPDYCFTNQGPFLGLDGGPVIWSGTEYVLDSSQVWYFASDSGVQQAGSKDFQQFAWAMQSGDVSPVPVPAAAWLFGSALIGLAGIKRKK